jgi:hypothetical protein
MFVGFSKRNYMIDLSNLVPYIPPTFHKLNTYLWMMMFELIPLNVPKNSIFEGDIFYVSFATFILN